MKHYNFYYVLIFLLSIAIHAKNQTVTRQVTTNPGSTLPNFVYMTSVSSDSFRNTGETTLQKTFTISTPGHYVLVQDIGFQNAQSAQNAIYINSSNVTLDLGGRTVYAGSGAGGTMSGILIEAAKNNITIKNGNITGFSEYGIETTNCRNLRIENISIGECIIAGIYLNGSSATAEVSELFINNCIISHCVRTGGASTALHLNYAYNATLSNILIGRTTTASSGEVRGLNIQNSHNITVINCDTCAGSSATDSYGTYVSSSKNIAFLECNASGNAGAGDSVGYGFYTNSTYGVSFTKCTAQNNYGASAGSGTGSGYGFYNNSSYATSYINCEASSNYSGNTGSGVGFYTTSSSQSYFENCRSTYNNGGSMGASGYGFYQTSSEKNIYKSCTALGNKGAAGASGVSQGGHGFISISGVSTLYDSCVSSGNITNTNATSTASTGFFADNESDTVWINCEARANGSDSIEKNSGGFYLDDSTSSCVRCVINGCTSFGHRTGGTGAAYGFYDEAAATTTLIIDCFAFGNKTANYYLADGSGSSYVSVNAATTNEAVATITARNPFENVSINVAS